MVCGVTNIMNEVAASEIIKWMFIIIWVLMILGCVYTQASIATYVCVISLIMLTSGMTVALTIKYLSWCMNG
jgi:hypothetical protein